MARPTATDQSIYVDTLHIAYDAVSDVADAAIDAGLADAEVQAHDLMNALNEMQKAAGL